MTKEEWQELDHLSYYRNTKTKKAKKRFWELVEKTHKIDEHPEDYEGYCECQLCASYAQ